MEEAESPRLEAQGTSIARAWAAIAILVPIIVVLMSDMSATDLTYHLRAGDEIWADWELPSVDTWTFGSGGSTWLDQQWGAQVIFSAIFGLAEWSGLQVAWAALTGLSFGFVYAACRVRGAGSRWAAVLTLTGFVVSMQSIVMRPQMLAIPAFAIALWAAVSRSTHPRRLWLVPVLAALVSNVHGSFVLFPLLAALTLVEDLAHRAPWQRSAWILLATSLATMLNPFGVRAWTYAYDLATNDTIRESIVEWQPVTLASLTGVLLFVSTGATLIVLLRHVKRSSSVPWIDLFTLGIFLTLGFLAQRSSVWWGLIVPVVIAAWVPREEAADTRAPSEGERTGASPRAAPLPALVIVGTLLLVTVGLLPTWRSAGRELIGGVPFGVTDRASELPAGSRVFVHQPWGSWFEHATPHVLVFVDSRIELFDTDTWDDYDEVAFAGARWQQVLEERDPDAIVAAADWDLLPLLREDPGWSLVYEDDEGLLFVKA